MVWIIKLAWLSPSYAKWYWISWEILPFSNSIYFQRILRFRSVYYNFAAPRMFENHSIGEFENISLVTMGKDEITAHFDTIEKFYLTNNNQTYLINNEFSIADVFTAITISSLEPLLFDFSPWPTLCKWFEKVKTDIAKTSQYNNRCKFLSRPRILWCMEI